MDWLYCVGERSGPGERSKRKRKEKKNPALPFAGDPRRLTSSWNDPGPPPFFLSLYLLRVVCTMCRMPLFSLLLFLSRFSSSSFFRALVWVYAREFQRRRARRGEEGETASICRARNKLDTVSRHVSLRTSLFLLIKLFILTTTVMKEGLLRHSNKCNATGFSNTFLFRGMCCVSLYL